MEKDKGRRPDKDEAGRAEYALLLRWIVALVREVRKMSAELDKLTEEVARNTEVDQSAIALLNGLATQIEQLKQDPVKLQALADSLRSSSDSLAEAVVANTPAEPPV